jgi:hypothetical protein
MLHHSVLPLPPSQTVRYCFRFSKVNFWRLQFTIMICAFSSEYYDGCGARIDSFNKSLGVVVAIRIEFRASVKCLHCGANNGKFDCNLVISF